MPERERERKNRRCLPATRPGRGEGAGGALDGRGRSSPGRAMESGARTVCFVFSREWSALDRDLDVFRTLVDYIVCFSLQSGVLGG